MRYKYTMLFQLPDHDTLYRALQNRDVSYDGRVYVCVMSTGIFCRLSCPARDPKPQNCRFVETVAECIAGGFRACKRCHPLAPEATADPAVQKLLAALEADPDRRWNEDGVRQMGLDPSTVRRSFKRQFGITFLEMARIGRLRRGFETLADGAAVVDAQCSAGFESASAFRDAFAKLLGQSPGGFAANGKLKADWIDTPIGAMIAVADRRGLHLLEFVERKALPNELKKLSKRYCGDIGIGRYAPTDQVASELQCYFSGDGAQFQVPLIHHASPFTCKVWDALRQIPAGQTRSYGEVACDVGRPAAVRAVARANGANPIAIVVPCHRVLGADGSLTGYGGGLWRKQRLIELERQYAASLMA